MLIGNLSVKDVIFDVDGVIVTGCPRASEVAIQKFGLNPNLVQTFFRTKWHDCVEGRVCLEELLLKELPVWGFSGSVKDYLEFWFSTESRVDHDLLQLVLSLRQNGIRCHLGSNQEKFRAHYLWENCQLKNYFDGCFFSGHMGFAKPNIGFYSKIQATLHRQPNEIALIDDTIENIQAAQSVGWKGILWPSHNLSLEFLAI